MLFHEWNLDDAKKIGREEGVAIGEARGEDKVLDLLAKGYTLEQIKKALKKQLYSVNS